MIGCGGLQRYAVSNEDEPKEKHHVNVSLYAGGSHSWAPANRENPEHVGVPRRKTEALPEGRCQHAYVHHQEENICCIQKGNPR